MQASVHLRSYSSELPKESHTFAQIVLPLAGSLELDVGGKQAPLNRSQGAFIHRDIRHTQQGLAKNRSLIVDVDQNSLSDLSLELLHSQVFIELAPTTVRLIDYMRRLIANQSTDASIIARWVPLLLDHISHRPVDATTRLSALKALVEIDPFQPWSVERMADQTGVSASRLHALFREQFDETPHAWLAATRMSKVCELLARSNVGLAEIAYRAGFSDQTALTRAMRNATGLTPAAYRRDHQPRTQPQ